MNAIRFVEAQELRANVGFEDLIEPVSMAFQETSAHLAESGLLIMYPAKTASSGDVYVKTGTLRGHRVYVVKVSPWFAANVELGRAQGGFIAVFDSETGHTLAILNEQHYLSDIRTAAAGCLAARVLAPGTVQSATVLGSGVQAYWQPQALYRERRFETLLIWARNLDKAELLKQRLSHVLPAVTIQVEPNLETAVRESQVLITATLSREPLVRGDWLVAGQHITAVGADDPMKCELDASALRRARVFVDSLDASSANGDVGSAIQAGGYALDQVAGEIGEVLAGTKPGRVSSQDITIAKFVGIGAQDLVAAEASLARLGAMRL
jgi:ornithine cyclodeaminase/alanine dehydrogenase-like protein (mu-crystallin family)